MAAWEGPAYGGGQLSRRGARPTRRARVDGRNDRHRTLDAFQFPSDGGCRTGGTTFRAIRLAINHLRKVLAI